MGDAPAAQHAQHVSTAVLHLVTHLQGICQYEDLLCTFCYRSQLEILINISTVEHFNPLF